MKTKKGRNEGGKEMKNKQRKRKGGKRGNGR